MAGCVTTCLPIVGQSICEAIRTINHTISNFVAFIASLLLTYISKLRNLSLHCSVEESHNLFWFFESSQTPYKSSAGLLRWRSSTEDGTSRWRSLVRPVCKRLVQLVRGEVSVATWASQRRSSLRSLAEVLDRTRPSGGGFCLRKQESKTTTELFRFFSMFFYLLTSG